VSEVATALTSRTITKCCAEHNAAERPALHTGDMPTELRARPAARAGMTLIDWFDGSRRGCFAGRIDIETAAADDVLLWDDDAVIERCDRAQAASHEAAA
jgi:hypothetical protein